MSELEELQEQLADAHARIAVLEQEDREWDKHSLVQIVNERNELQAACARLNSELMASYGENMALGEKVVHLEATIAAMREACRVPCGLAVSHGIACPIKLPEEESHG